MASQDPAAAVPLVHAPDGVGYRLLELPPALVDDATPWSLVSSADGLARLCAGGRTYALRQKNTSNALVLLRTAAVGPAVDGPSSASALGAVAAVATLHETVELVEDAAAHPAASPAPAAAPAAAARPAAAAASARGKWHERFGRSR